VATAFSGTVARFRDPLPSAWAATVGLGAAAVLATIAAVAALRYVSSSDLATIVIRGDETVLPSGGLIFVRISPFVSLATYVTWLVWQYRVHENARLVDPVGARTTPAWGVLSWFVPFLNFVKPFLVVREIQRASAGADPVGPRVLAWCWWATWLSSFVGAVILVTSTVFDVFDAAGTVPLPDGLVVPLSDLTVQAFVVTELLLVACAAFAVAIVWDVTRRQHGHPAAVSHGVPVLAAVTAPPRPDLG
jgi:hypothetical protein